MTAIVDLADLSRELGTDFASDPYPTFAELRRRGPVHRIRMARGTDGWLVVGYDEVRATLADPRLSKEWRRAAEKLRKLRVSTGYHMLGADPPDHTRLRRLVTREFTPERLRSLAPRVQQITDELLAAMLSAPEGRADLVTGLAFPLPITVICELLGVPHLAREHFRTWSNTLLGPAPPEEKQSALRLMKEHLVGLVAAKRETPGEDLLSALITTADEDGDRLSPDELLATAWLMLVAGHETTVHLVTNGVLSLLRHPAQLAALRADWGLLDGAVEEMLRYDGPVLTSTFRFTVEPVEIGGVVIPGGGELVLPVIGDAHRDAARFEDPERFDIRRETRGHLAFGHGIHHCLGASLGRLEGAVAIRSLWEAAPDLALDEDPAALSWRGGMLIRGPDRLLVRWR
ncbi:cytochrome P450 family protein [Streptomyces sp. 4N509B]|uniref:cytochrome P450 family protein n=1 Tax=Streptomyces sp. 4N509B TaxID=3457413 RepID=UPI003FD008F2